MRKDTRDIVVIGSGLGGLSAALILAHAGKRVTIVEKNSKVGGKLGELEIEGYRFDTGPSLLTMPFVLEDLLSRVDEKLSDHLNLKKIDPICRYFYPNGSVINAWHSLEDFRSEVSLLSASDANNLADYFQYSQQIYDTAAPLFLFSQFQNLSNLLSIDGLRTLFNLKHLDALRTVNGSNKRFFTSPEVIQLFNRYATYSGSNPYTAPATLNIIPHVEYTLGSYYVSGGLYRIAEVLINLIEARGGTFLLGTAATKIVHDGRSISAVELANGETLHASSVIANSDVVWTFENLIKGFPQKEVSLRRLEPSCSGLVFLWGMRAEHNRLTHHNIFFSSDYPNEFEEIFTHKVPPTEPTIYVSITSKSDAEHSPPGGENWFVLLNMPALHDKIKWDEHLLDKMREVVFNRLEAFGLSTVREHIVVERTITPQDFLDHFNTNRGSIYGISSNSKFAAFLREPNRSRTLRGLYFATGSAHPGGGIPLVLLSGVHAAESVLAG